MLLLEHFCRWNDYLVNHFLIIQVRVDSLALLAMKHIFEGDPKHAINKEVGWRLTMIRNEECTLNSELLAFYFVGARYHFPHSHEESLLPSIIHNSTNGPHERVLENHVEPLSYLIRLH